MRDLSRSTIVVTGASSGVGRATAHAFARRGARLALAARGEEPLRRAAEECRALGGTALAVPTDVTDAAAVRRLARTAAEAFGTVDVWINNAGIGLVGRFADAPIEAHRRVVETNLFGCLHGAHAALPYFFDQGSGVLINNVSVGGFAPAPYAAAYAASKFALRGFCDSLRQELADRPDVHVCAVYPYFMDTPGIQHAANHTGRALSQAFPLYRPETTAAVMVELALRPRPEVVVGVLAKLARLPHGIAPRLTEWGLARAIELYLRQASPAPVTDGNLFRPSPPPMAVHGGWRRPGLRAGLLAALGVAAGAAAAGLLARR